MVRRRNDKRKSIAVKRNKTWTCPYFTWDGRKEISCEGGRLEFPTAAAAVAYMDTFCAGGNNWRHCTLAEALTKHYEEEN